MKQKYVTKNKWNNWESNTHTHTHTHVGSRNGLGLVDIYQNINNKKEVKVRLYQKI